MPVWSQAPDPAAVNIRLEPGVQGWSLCQAMVLHALQLALFVEYVQSRFMAWRLACLACCSRLDTN